MNVQDSQSELDDILFGLANYAHGIGAASGYGVFIGGEPQRKAKQAIEAYVTTRVKEVLYSLRDKTSQNPEWPKDYKFARSEYDIAITESIEALTTTTNGKGE